ncbi:MAG: hypothetical protein ACP5O6_03510 [Candidatus Baltobacteraceae bacterium]
MNDTLTETTEMPENVAVTFEESGDPILEDDEDDDGEDEAHD